MFKLRFHPFMDAEGDVGGGTVTPQGSEGNLAGEGQTGGATGTEGNPGSQGTQGVSQPVTDPASQSNRQSPETDAAFAKMRREAEQARREAEQAKRDTNIAKKYGKDYGVYSEADIAAQYGSQGINTLTDFEAAIQAEEYRKQGINPDVINQILENHPTMQAAKKMLGDSAIGKEITELTAEYPDLKIKTLDDLRKLPNSEAIIAKAQKGYSLLDAYEAVNREDIRKTAKEQGAAQTIRNINSKNHLGTEKSGNQPVGKEIEISPEQMRVWEAMGYKPDEARKRAAKYLKK